MRIPRYWQRVEEPAQIKGRRFTLCAWGHSDRSPEEARSMAVERLPRIREAIVSGRTSGSYDYFANPIREPRIETLGPEGRESAVVTRNGYGALVLNAAQVMFIDIDVAPGRRFLFWGKTTAKKKEAAAARAEQTARSRGLSVRIYETAGGLRVAALDKPYDPDGDEAAGIMEAFGTDPLYLRLCRAQKCFRARLTPKPWRIGVDRPPFRFPEDPEVPAYRDWIARYDRAGAPYRVCRLVTTVGSRRDRGVEEVLRLHDERSRLEASGDLA